MDLEGFYAMQNKSDREREIVYDLIYMWNQKKKTSNELTNKIIEKLIYIHREQMKKTTCGNCRKGEGGTGNE